MWTQLAKSMSDKAIIFGKQCNNVEIRLKNDKIHEWKAGKIWIFHQLCKLIVIIVDKSDKTWRQM